LREEGGRESEGGGGDDGLEREGGDWEGNKMSALTRTEKAHQKYREGKYNEALELYTDALNAASQVNHRVALHSNRAACHLKLQSYKQVRRRVVMYTLNVTYQALILTFQFLQIFVISPNLSSGNTEFCSLRPPQTVLFPLPGFLSSDRVYPSST
jgi:hypothetical protein